MNISERLPPHGPEAVVDYRAGDFHVVKPGAFVRCAVTGVKIPLNQLRYWNVDKQEAYADAAAAMKGFGVARRG